MVVQQMTAGARTTPQTAAGHLEKVSGLYLRLGHGPSKGCHVHQAWTTPSQCRFHTALASDPRH